MKCFLFHPTAHGKKARLFSCRIRLDGWQKARTFPLHVTDRRVASQKLAELLREIEQEQHGIIAPKLLRDAAQTPIADHLRAFLADLKALRRAPNTLARYESVIPTLCERCGWVMVRDVTESSFVAWRAKSSLHPKTLNTGLGAMGSLLNWMERQKLILANPLKHVQKVANHAAGSYRRALSLEQVKNLLAVAPPHRAIVYQTVLYTGVRRAELNGLKREDFDLEGNPPRLRVPSSISKNRKPSEHYLRPELVESLKGFISADAQPSALVFRGRVPRVATFKKDLTAAGIPFEDGGRRVDFHSLRNTFITLLSVAGVSPRTAMALARHSDIKLTMNLYTDPQRLGLQEGMTLFPSFSVPNSDAPRAAPAGVFSGHSA